MIAAFALAGCGEAKTMDEAKGPVAVPTFVQAMMEAPIPVDGEIHVQSRGRFEIRPDTLFCTHADAEGLDGAQLRDALRRIGQSFYQNGASRASSSTDKNCMTGDSVRVQGFRSLGADGSYKFILPIWQGEAAWVGRIERAEGVRSDAVVGIAGEGGDVTSEQLDKRRQEISITLDSEEISRKFLDTLPNDQPGGVG